MIDKSSYDMVGEIAYRAKRDGDVLQHRALRTAEELGTLINVYRTSRGRYLTQYHYGAEVLICSLVNVMAVASVSLDELNERLEKAQKSKCLKPADSDDLQETDYLLSYMALHSGTLATSFVNSLSPEGFAYHSFKLVDDTYRFLKALAPDPCDEFLNAQIGVIHQLWSAKSKLAELERFGHRSFV